MKLESGKYYCTMLPEQYVKAVVPGIQEDLTRSGNRLPPKCAKPLSENYATWQEDSPELMVDGVQQYQEIIIHLRWAIYIGRLDILLETFLLLIYMTMPRVRHLEKAFHVFGYLKAHPKRKLGFDPDYLAINKNRFQQCEWVDFYRDSQEEIPGNIPVVRGNFMSAHCFIAADHAGDTETRLSHTSILFFFNSAPIIWFRKRQNSVETSTFRSYFTAMNNAVERIEALRYKLRMFWVPIYGSKDNFCDNGAVCVNTTLTELTMYKKHISIAYHCKQEAVVAGTFRVSKEHTKTTLADMLTNTMAAPNREGLL